MEGSSTFNLIYYSSVGSVNPIIFAPNGLNWKKISAHQIENFLFFSKLTQLKPPWSDFCWDKNVDYLVKDANRRMLMLHAASKFTSDKNVLKLIYYSRIRCKLDQSAVVWNSSLTQKNVSDLKRVQNSAVRIICGKNYESYSDTLSELGMMRLSER